MRIRFVQKCIDYIRKKDTDKGVWSVPYEEPKCTYKKIICTLGFGHSGSGAVLDLLSEFSNTTILGFHDNNGSQYDKKSYGELDFARRFGGVFDLETAFKLNNNNIRDYKLKCFITLTEYYYSKGFLYTDKFYEITNEFIDKLIDFKINASSGCEANPAFMFKKGCIPKFSNFHHPFLKDKYAKKYIYYLKDLNVEEYIKIASKYIENVLNTVESKEYLVLDQFMSDDEADLERMVKYLGKKAKCIAVYRDPRDVYATALQLNVPWIPHDVKTFVKWYSYSLPKYAKVKHDNFLMLRFEDLIFDYDDSVDKITEFLCLDKACHVKRQSYFVPSISSKNVGLYKDYCPKEAIEYIETELGDYCYKKELK